MDEELLRRAYGAFNARNIDAALALMQPAVRWPNGIDGGFVRGHGGLRQYWTQQWKQTDPRAEPLAFSEALDGRIVVDVCLRVRERPADLVSEKVVQHVYSLRAGLIESMEIRGLLDVEEAAPPLRLQVEGQRGHP